MDKSNSSVPKNQKQNDKEPSATKTYYLEVTEARSPFFHGNAYYWCLDDTKCAISPLFASRDGAYKWIHYFMANDFLECRVFQWGNHCLLFIEGVYCWWDDMEQNFTKEPTFTDYDKAIAYKMGI